jgi:hypothetical protein
MCPDSRAIVPGWSCRKRKQKSPGEVLFIDPNGRQVYFHVLKEDPATNLGNVLSAHAASMSAALDGQPIAFVRFRV